MNISLSSIATFVGVGGYAAQHLDKLLSAKDKLGKPKSKFAKMFATKSPELKVVKKELCKGWSIAGVVDVVDGVVVSKKDADYEIPSYDQITLQMSMYLTDTKKAKAGNCELDYDEEVVKELLLSLQKFVKWFDKFSVVPEARKDYHKRDMYEKNTFVKTIIDEMNQ